MSMLLETYDTGMSNEELFYKVMYLPYKFTRTDDPPTEKKPDVDMAGMYWTHQLYNFCPVSNPDYFQNPGLQASEDPIYLDILGYLEAVCPKMPKRENLYSAYVNVLKDGDMPGVHVDSPYFVEDSQTVLLYLNPEWHPNWGGETIFYDHNLDAKYIVSPKPGRVVIFDGRIPHSGRPPTPRYKSNRYIMAFKYMDPKTRQKLFDDHEMNNLPPVNDHGILGFNPSRVEQIMTNARIRP